MARDWAMARTRDRPRLRARAMVSSRARARAWECVSQFSAYMESRLKHELQSPKEHPHEVWIIIN